MLRNGAICLSYRLQFDSIAVDHLPLVTSGFVIPVISRTISVIRPTDSDWRRCNFVQAMSRTYFDVDGHSHVDNLCSGKPAASLATLYNVSEDSEERALAVNYAPLIRLDTNEPFVPLAAGYTIFRADSQSPSLKRRVHLSLGWRQRAALAIEYAIWWDWDINHLYELEHIWVYITDDGQVARVEGSWHGKVNILGRKENLALEGNRPVVCAAPGKHALATSIDRFQERQAKIPGLTTRYAGVNGIVLNDLFVDQIWRTPPWDRLIQSYLASFAFVPSWDFSRTFSFDDQMFVPWAALKAWIPGRVHAWLEQLEGELWPDQYQYLRIVDCGSIDELRRASQLQVDMVQLGVGRSALGLPVMTDATVKNTRTSLITAVRICAKEQLGAYLVIRDRRVISWLARLLGRRDWSDYVMIGAGRPEWLREVKSKLPQYRTALILDGQTQNAIVGAKDVRSSYVHLCSSENTPDLAWVRRVRRAGLGVILGPTEALTATQLSSLGVEAIVARQPITFFAND